MYISFNRRLKKFQANDDEFDAKLDRFMGLFKLMTNIDKFEECYRRTLSRRLLAEKSADSDNEKNIVARIKV